MEEQFFLFGSCGVKNEKMKILKELEREREIFQGTLAIIIIGRPNTVKNSVAIYQVNK